LAGGFESPLPRDNRRPTISPDGVSHLVPHGALIRGRPLTGVIQVIRRSWGFLYESTLTGLRRLNLMGSTTLPLMPETRNVTSAKSHRIMAAGLCCVTILIVGYWVAWFTDRSLVASEHSVAYVQFYSAFPVADGWLALCLVAAAYGLLKMRPITFLWLLAGGGAGLYLFAMDDLYDLQHGLWEKRPNGYLELGVNILTFLLSLFVLRWSWVRRDELLQRSG
jgi:hypothetical protein